MDHQPTTGFDLVDFEYLRYTLPGFVYSVGLAPAAAAAALAALEIVEAEPERVLLLRKRCNEFRSRLVAAGIGVGLSESSAVMPWIVGKSTEALRIAAGLNQQGILVHSIISPAVKEGSARLRFFVSSAHGSDQIEHTVSVILGIAESRV